eukprot:CRZ05743.1 hypothetical protein [Spongospora subterranea]
MFINEPKTPFHYTNSDHCADEIVDLEISDADDGKICLQSFEGDGLPAGSNESCIDQHVCEWDDTEITENDNGPVLHQSEKFKSKRHNHYNEFATVRRFRKKDDGIISPETVED